MQEILEFIIYLTVDMLVIGVFVFMLGLYASGIFWGFMRIPKIYKDHQLYKAKTDKYIIENYKDALKRAELSKSS